jgi:hypothetical protein
MMIVKGIGNVFNLLWLLATIAMTAILIQATIANNYQSALVPSPILWGTFVCAGMFVFMPRGL